MITWYANKSFISTFARAQFFTIQGSFLLIYKQELKSGKVTSQLTCERRSLFQDITYLSINLGWLTLFVRSKVKRGDSFTFKMLLTIFSLQAENLLAKCPFSKKDILQIIRNSGFNKAHGMIWSAFVCWNWWLDLPISKRWFSKCDIKFSNVILDSENNNFNGLQIFDA